MGDYRSFQLLFRCSYATKKYESFSSTAVEMDVNFAKNRQRTIKDLNKILGHEIDKDAFIVKIQDGRYKINCPEIAISSAFEEESKYKNMKKAIDDKNKPKQISVTT